jgi:hypothetical protein
MKSSEYAGGPKPDELELMMKPEFATGKPIRLPCCKLRPDMINPNVPGYANNKDLTRIAYNGRA